MVSEGRLIDLSESVLSNHIGVTTLLVTGDDQIVLQEQGDQMVEARKISVGASGSAVLADCVGADGRLRTLQETIRSAMEREVSEEVSAAVGPHKSRTWITGHARYLSRGGKPEFYGITRSVSRLEDLHPAKQERGYVHRVYGRGFEPGAQGLAAAIERLLRDGDFGSKSLSLSMVVCLRLALDHLARTELDVLSGSLAT
jgi:hypothetical protein